MSKFSDLSSHFRIYGDGTNPHGVARDLQQHFSPYALVREMKGKDAGFYVLDVDDDLLRILERTRVTKLSEVLPELQRTTNHFGRQFSARATTSSLRGGKKPGVGSILDAISKASPPAAPHVIIDRKGTVLALRAEPAPPADVASLYPHLDGPKAIEPDAVAEFSLRLDALTLAGSGTLLQVTFPEGAKTLTINARVSTAEFSMPAGEAWGREFTVDRDLNVTPAVWPIKARAIGDRKQFTLAVIFNAAGTPLGSVTQTVPRKGTAPSEALPKQSANTLVLPEASGAGVVLELARQAAGYMVSVYEKGRLAGGPVSWEVTGQDFFDDLQRATTEEAFDRVANGIAIEMADEITDLLDRKDLEGIATLIISDERVAPFEAMKLRRSQNGPLLGADRPVVRWISKKGMALVPAGSKIACIRPNYPDKSGLPSAQKEEEDLSQRYPQMTVVRTSTQFDQLLERTDVGMVHFAGHSRGNPPNLILEDGPVHVMKFSSSSKLMLANPVIFANGCRAGQSLSGFPAMQANFAKIVLKSGASGFIAPMIEIDSPAALECEKVFYRALETDTVAEAVRKVRALAKTTEEKQKSTCASYAAFVSTELRLHLT